MFEANFLGTLIERGYRIIFTRACIVGEFVISHCAHLHPPTGYPRSIHACSPPASGRFLPLECERHTAQVKCGRGNGGRGAPRTRPISYHTRSAINAAEEAGNRTAAQFKSPECASAP